jgi:hypothetical protein
MLRNFVSAALMVGLLAVAGRTAEDKKTDEDQPDKPKQIMGKIKKVDAEKGILIVTTGTGEKQKDEVIKIDDDTTFMIPMLGGGKPTKLEGKDGLKAKALKAGVSVQVMRLGKGKQMVMVMPALGRPTGRNPALAMGKIKKIDEEKGVLILTVGDKDEAKDKEIKITDDVSVMSFSRGEKPKKVTGKAILKEKDLLKIGAVVQVFRSPDGKTMIMLGSFPTRPQGGDPMREGVTGKIKKMDAEKGTLILTVDGKDMEIKTTEETKFMVRGSKPISAKEALKKEAFKEGAHVRVMKGPDGNAMMIMSVPAVKKPKIEE